MTKLLTRVPTPTLLARYQPTLQAAWSALIKELYQAARKQPHASGAAKVFYDYALKPGKFVRPSLFLSGYELYGSGASSAVVELSLSFELLHLALLIEDDVMDQSPQRRGRPSLHEAYVSYHSAHGLMGNPEVFGRNLAMLMSDLCTSYSETIWTKAYAQKIANPKLKNQFDRLAQTVYWGQHTDIMLQSLETAPSLEDILGVMREKTARYTIYYPLYIGALAGDASSTQISWIKDFALNLGILFQIVDDFLGTFGNADKLGKSVDSDIAERKQTLLVYFALSAATAADRYQLESYYFGQRDLEVDQIRTIFERSGVEKQIMGLAKLYHDQSLTALEQSALPAKQQALFKEVADYLLTRKR